MDDFAGYRDIQPLDLDSNPQVYAAQGADGSQVHLKIFPHEGRSGESTLRIKRDLEVLAGVECVRILTVKEHGAKGDDLWYAVEAPQAPTLEEQIQKRFGDTAEQFTMAEVLQLAIGVGEALGYLHDRNLVYGHLSGENVLIHPVMGPVLREVFPGSSTGRAADDEVASLRYASPEQVQLENVKATSDVYQSGLLLYHALTGGLPLEDENPFQTVLRRMQEDMPAPSRRRKEIPEELDRILLKCLQAKPEKRYQDMNAFLEELLRLDPESGQLLPGQEMPGLHKAQQDTLMGLIVPQDDPPKAVPVATSMMAAILPGIVAGLVLLGGLLLALR